MRGANCGCELAEEARKEDGNDIDAARALREAGKEAAEQWRCPFVCGGGEPAQASDEVAPVLAEVERVTGATGLRTCPNWYASQKGCQTVAQARLWAERGLLKERYGRPSLALYEAIEALDAARSARDRDDDERREREREAKRK